MAPLRTAAEKRWSGDFSPMWAGQNASGCREIPAGDLTRALAAGVRA
jgi:nitronate monooxygenase